MKAPRTSLELRRTRVLSLVVALGVGALALHNLAHMTLGEYPDGVDPRHRLDLKPFFDSKIDIGRFHEIGQRVGLNRYNSAGGAIMDDFDNDGLLDVVVTSFAPDESMSYHRNRGDGTFEDRTKEPGLSGHARGSGKFASGLSVALEAQPAEIGGLFFSGRNLVRVVTRNAVKTTPARAITATFLHLFDLTNEPGLLLVSTAVNRHEVDQRKTRRTDRHLGQSR